MDTVELALLGGICLLFLYLLLLPLWHAAAASAFPSAAPPSALLGVFGSGGHTKELLSVLRWLPPGPPGSTRAYVCADSDHTSLSTAVAQGVLSAGEARAVHVIARAREVGQPALAAAWGTARGLLQALAVVHRVQPTLLLVNGPGTCIPVCAAAVLLRALGLAPARLTIVLVESVCRVRSLSLSGHLAYWLGLADLVAVQWPQLQQAFPRAVYVGLQV